MSDADEPVWIPVLPDMSGFGGQLSRGLSGMRSTADRGGRQVGQAIAGGAEAGLGQLRDTVEKTAKAQEDAAGRVRVAEAKLQDLRDSGRAKTSQIVAAEEALARSRRNLETATGRQQRATRALADGQASASRDTDTLAADQRDLADAQEEATQSSGRLKGALAGLGAATAALIGKNVGDLLGIEAANDRLAAQLDLTGPMSARAGRLAGRLFRDGYGENIGAVNEAIRGVQTNIGDLGDFSNRELEGMGRRALDLANILGEDVSRVTRGVGQLMRNGLAKNATEGFDLITRAAQQLPADMQGELLDTIEEYGASFKELGLTGPQALGAISAAVKAGARNTDLAADALKEFSIRAVDGSDTTRQGYKALGLDADRMANRIAAGGPAASKATSQVIRALGRMRDPVKREAAGVALFGTQYEDLGIKAIRALDPMSSRLDRVGGATDRMGKTLNDNFAARMEVWKRNVMGFVQDGLMRLVDVGGQAFNWARENKTTVAVFAGVLAGLTAVTVAHSIAMAVGAAGGLAAWLRTTRLITVATRVWAAVQWVLNAALRANPIGIVITALTALGVGLVIAYKKSATFRDIVDRAWAGIKRAVSSAWRMIRPVLVQLAGWIATKLIPTVRRLWKDVVVPAFRAIGRAVKFAWSNVIKPAFSALRGFLTGVVFPVIRRLWTGVVRPIFKLIGFGIRVWWGGVVRPIFMALRAFFTGVLFPVFRFLWTRVVRPVMQSVGSGIRNAWNNVIKPVFRALGDFITNTVKPAFSRAVNAIGNIWDGLKEKARRPVAFLVNTVYNSGIRAMMNKIPGVSLPAAAFAAGGPVSGGVPGKDSVHALMMPGEHVLTAKEVENAGGHRAIYRLRELLANRRMNKLGDLGLPTTKSGRRLPSDVPRFAGGGTLSAAQISRAQAFARGEAGKPYIWGGVGPDGYDCSGFLSAITNVIRGLNPYGRVGTSASFPWGGFVPGPGQFTIGAFTGSPGHVAGTLGGMNVESTNGSVRVGSAARGAGDPMFTRVAHLGKGGNFGSGGIPPAAVKGEARKDSILDAIKSLPSMARNIWNNIQSMGAKFAEWGSEFKNAGVSTIRSAVTWADNKIPDKIVIDNWPDIPLPDNPLRDALGAIGIFDRGGWLKPGGVAMNRSSKPEPVFNAQQWGTLRALTHTGASVLAGSGMGALQIDIEVYGEVDQDTVYIQGLARDVYRAESRADRRARPPAASGFVGVGV